MTEEIKEILEALKPHNDIKEYPLYLNRKQQDLLYDYITNLQQLYENGLKVCVAEHKYGVEKAEEARDYKSRCEKANKIITDFMCTEEYCSVDPVAIAENYMEIQKALNGSDKSE